MSDNQSELPPSNLQETPNIPDLTPEQKLNITKNARQALRAIRFAATHKNTDRRLSPEHMQAMASTLVQYLGEVLTHQRPSDDLNQIITSSLSLSGPETISHGGQQITKDLIQLSETYLSSPRFLNKKGLPHDAHLVMPLSTGPALMSIASVKHNIPFFLLPCQATTTK